jgi:Uncharacterized ATPase, putative transposase
MQTQRVVSIAEDQVSESGDVGGGIAAIANVSIAQRALERAMKRESHLPGLVAYYGPSGFGKTFAATYAANRHRAYHVAVKSTWTAKALLLNVLREMGIRPARTIYDMADQAAEQLSLSARPLIIDEFDFLVTKSAVEVVRDLHESSGGAAILLIGEEQLEKNLRRWERFHNRVLEWVAASPASLADCRQLAALYSPDVDISDELLERVLRVSRGITRRVCVNLSAIHKAGLDAGLERMTLADWGQRPLDSGEAPRRVL